MTIDPPFATAPDLWGPRIAKNVASLTLGSALALAAGSVAGLAVARHLGPGDYGSFSVVWSIVWTTAVAVPLGFDVLLVRELSRTDRLLDLGRVLPVVAAVGAGAAATLVAVGWVAQIDGRLLVALAAGGAYIVVSGPLALVTALFNARERMELTGTVVAAEGLIALAGVLLVLQLGGGLVAISVALAAGGAGALGLAALLLRVSRGGDARPRIGAGWPALLRTSLPMWGSQLLGEAARRIDIVVLGLLVPPRQVGLYMAASVIVVHAPIGLLGLTQALYPGLSRAADADDGTLARILDPAWQVLLTIGVAATTTLAIVATPLLGLLFGAAYEPAGRILAVLVWTVPFRVLAALCATTVDATGGQVRRLQAIGASGAVHLALTLALIGPFGLLGAAVASVLAEGVFLGALLAALGSLRPPLLRPFGEAVLVAAPVAAATLLMPGHVLVRTGVGVGVFAAAGAARWATGHYSIFSPGRAG